MELIKKLFTLLGLFFICLSGYIIIQQVVNYESIIENVGLLMILFSGIAIVYFTLYYKQHRQKANSQLIKCVKWSAIYIVAILFGDYIAIRLMITNPLYIALFTAFIVAIIVHIAHTHSNNNHYFKIKWFLFFFLIYTIIIRLVDEILIQQISFTLNLIPYIITGFLLTAVVFTINHMDIKGNSINWINFIFILLLFVLNIELVPVINDYYQNPSDLTSIDEQRLRCPTPLIKGDIFKDAQDLRNNVQTDIINLIDNSIWTIENKPRTCYQGKYVNQNPDWFYCDDMIVSRWETNNLGLIRYRWYTAVSSEWKPIDESRYTLDGFSCESGQRVTVRKEATSYYVHVSRDGTEIRIEY